MKMFIFILLAFLTLFSACNFWDSKINKDKESTSLVNLVESTHIIRILISQNKLADILEDHDSEQLTVLLDNFSPAQMAFESEVLSSTVPLIVVYYFNEHTKNDDFIGHLKKYSNKYADKIKFVLVDADHLFSLARDAEIEKFPTIIFIENREIVERIENSNVKQLEDALLSYVD